MSYIRCTAARSWALASVLASQDSAVTAQDAASTSQNCEPVLMAQKFDSVFSSQNRNAVLSRHCSAPFLSALLSRSHAPLLLLLLLLPVVPFVAMVGMMMMMMMVAILTDEEEEDDDDDDDDVDG
eukprot:236520-Rhodomonas_salina.1